MKQNFIVTKLLENDELQYIDDLLLESDTWKENSINLAEEKYEYSRDFLFKDKERTDAIHDLLVNKIRNDFLFYTYCVPDTITNSVILKMQEGCFSKIFNDSCLSGDYKTVVFLSDPESYEGGELVLFLDGQEIIFKLPKGAAVTYKTGVLGKTNLVTSGERVTANFMTNSTFKDEFMRDIYSRLSFLSTKLESKVYVDSFEEAMEDPYHLLTEVTDLILNNYGNKRLK